MAKAILLGNVKLKRAYEAPAVEDGTRILVDRLWPRGIKKADAAIDLWMKDGAPRPDCGNGLVTELTAGRNFANVMLMNCGRSLTLSTNFAL